MTIATICEILRRVNISTDPLSDLEELKAVLFTIHPSTLRNVEPNQEVPDFSQLFSYLNTNNIEQQKLVCETIERLLSGLFNPAQVCEQFKEELETGICHPVPEVNSLCLNQLLRVAKTEPNRLRSWSGIMTKIILQLGNSNLSVAKIAVDILVTLGKTDNGTSCIYSDPMLKDVMEKDDIVRFRVYQVIVEISRNSPEGLQKSEESGLMRQLTNEVFKNDVLLQLNAIEMLSDLAMCQHGLLYLDQSGVISKLEELMKATDSDAMASLLLPGLVKFFGGMSKFHPKEVCFKFPTFVNIVFNNLTSADEGQKNVAIDTVGFLGSTIEGKQTLEKLGQQTISGIKEIGNIIKGTKPDLQMRALDSLALLLSLKIEEQTDEMLRLTENWFNTMASEPFQFIWSLCQRPFVEIRCCAYNVMKVLATLPWAQKNMNTTPGFTEFLLNRSTETSKEGRDAKFFVVEALYKSPTVAENFGNPYYVKLAEYYQQGPYFIQAQAEVAMEGDGGDA